ncbi:MAG: hypothetical protein KAG64_08600 [Bacteroidales bacterium]|nr:hypothetical protein [Bacteroidales bacterium]
MKLSITLFFLFITLSSSAQELDEVFNDGNLSTVKNNIHFSLSDMTEGYINIGYDRYLGDHSSIGATVGLYLFNGPNLYYFGGNYRNRRPEDKLNFDSGFMFHLRARFFRFRSEGFFYQIGFMIRQTKLLNNTYSFLSVPETKFGYQISITDRIGATASVGIGLGIAEIKQSGSKSSIWNISDAGIFFPLNIEVHYNI